MSEVAAILLAAGRSERMGAFKPLLPFGKSTVIRNCIDHLREAGIERIVVVLGYRGAEVRKHLQNLPVHFTNNPAPRSEMSASIACGITQLGADVKVALIALTDQPAVPAAVITSLIDQWKAGAKLVIPEYEGRGGHPVLVDLSFREELKQLDPVGGLRSFFEAHRTTVRRVAVNSPYIARDMDTWDDYRALHEEVFALPPPDPGRDTQENGKH